MPDSKEYGGSGVVFLLGINESGKSNILEAIYKLRTGFGEGEKFHEAKFYEVCHKSAHEDGTSYAVISAQAQLTEEEQLSYQNLIAEKFPALKNDVKKIITNEVIKTAYCSKDSWGSGFTANVSLDGDVAFERYAKTEDSIVLADSIEESAGESFQSLTIGDLELFVPNQCEGYFNTLFPAVRLWKPSPEHLITAPIDLSEYLAGNIFSDSLTYLFFLYGKRDKDSINNAIEMALRDDEKKSELQDKLSKAITHHINSAWKEHQVNIKIKIDGSLLKVHVEDVDSEHTYYNMAQRSDGFKNFISLLLSLSAQYKGEFLNNNILLLDEPEAGMHPGGVRRMRDEILKMGRSNQIFVATHSPVMIDVDTPKRHWLVKKEKLETSLQSVGAEASMKDEEVMQMAFGINFIKMIAPDNLLVVEGRTDKRLLQFALNNLEEKSDISCTIQSAEGSKVPTFANMLDSYSINAVIFLDADSEGKKMQKKIIDNRSSFDSSNVFTLDNLINDNLPDDATIEDLIPENCVKQCLRDSGKQDNLDAIPGDKKVRVLTKIQSLNDDLKDEQAMSKIKLAMVERAIQGYSSEKKEEYARLFNLAKALLGKMREIRHT